MAKDEWPTRDEAEESSSRSTGTLSPQAQRALDEAQARRQGDAPVAPEIGGRGGLDPVRFGDWEVKGLTSDF